VALRRLTFTREERARLADICKVLGVTFEEFVHTATLHALDEIEGDRQYLGLLSKFLKENNG
jgi:hypothetical protein